MHMKGDNHWVYENLTFGSTSLSKNNYRHTLRYNDYNMMANRTQPGLKDDRYSNYYNNFMTSQNESVYNNNYGYVNNEQGVQSSQAVWGFEQTPYSFRSSCTSYTNYPNPPPMKQTQYPQGSFDRSVNHNFARFENPVMESIPQMPNYPPRYNHQQSNYENPQVNNSQMIPNNKRPLRETSKIQVRNVYDLNNSVRSETNNNISQMTKNTTGQMNYYIGCLPGQNENRVIPPMKQLEKICLNQENYRQIRPEQHESRESVTNMAVTKMCQNISNMNPVNLNINGGYYSQNNVPSGSNMCDRFPRDENTFQQRMAMENIYRKRQSLLQEALNSEKQSKALTHAMDQAKARSQENIMTVAGVPEKFPPNKNVTDVPHVEESVLLPKKPGSKIKALKKALVASQNRMLDNQQNTSNTQPMNKEKEELPPGSVKVKEEKSLEIVNYEFPADRGYKVETYVFENGVEDDVSIVKSKYAASVDPECLTSLVTFFKQDLRNGAHTPTVENNNLPRSENNQSNKRRIEGDVSNQNRKKLTKQPSNGMISLMTAKTAEVEEFENLKSLLLKECGLEAEPQPQPEVEPQFKCNLETVREIKASMKERNEEEAIIEIKQNLTDSNKNIIEAEINLSPEKVIGKTESTKRRSRKRSSTDSNKEKIVNGENEEKNKTKDTGERKTPDSELCSACAAKSKETDFENDSIFKTMKAFQNIKSHKCMSCSLTFPSNTFWINVITGELRCLNCFKKMVKKAEESSK